MAHILEDEWQSDEEVVPPPPRQTWKVNTRGVSRTNFRDQRSHNILNINNNRSLEQRDNFSRYNGQEKYSHRNFGRSNNSNCYNRNNFRNGQNDQNTNSKTTIAPTEVIGRIVGKRGYGLREIFRETGAKVTIGYSGGSVTDIILTGSDEAIKNAEEFILEFERPISIKRNYGEIKKEFMKVNQDGYEVVDWYKLSTHYDKQVQARYDKLPPKNFYVEDSVVARRTNKEVARWRLAHNNIQVRRIVDDIPIPIPNPVMTFEEAFRNYPEILEQIYKQDFIKPSPIQCQAWPILLKGEDMIGISQSGTGKTLAFTLPALIHIAGQTIPKEEREGPTVLILTPTRKSALQIYEEVSKYKYKDINTALIYCGGRRREHIAAVSSGVDIVIATPGRLIDLILSRHINMRYFSYIVFDRIDRMLDMGYEPQIEQSMLDVRPGIQIVMISATWNTKIDYLAKSYMIDPIQVNVGSLDLAVVNTITHQMEFVEKRDKEILLHEFFENRDPSDRIVVFCDDQPIASHICSGLAEIGVNCQVIDDDLNKNDKESPLENMRTGVCNTLVVTDLGSWSLDIKDLTHVVNFNFPRHIEEYVYRICMTSQSEKAGIAVSFITRDDLESAVNLIKISEEADQEVPDELRKIAQRFEAMKIRNN